MKRSAAPKKASNAPERTFDIVGIGRNSWDRLVVVANYPPADAKVEASTLDIQPGGQVATALVAASRLGARTRYLGKFGDDAGGRAVRASLSREGIDLSGCRVLTGVSNQSAFIVVDRKHHTRNVFSHGDPRLRIESDDFPHEAVTSGRILYLGGRNPREMIGYARTGRKAGCVVTVDADSAADGAAELLAHAHVVICSEPFVAEQTGERSIRKGLREISKLGPEFVSVTRGSRGAIALYRDRFFEQPAFSVDVVDTTGAGDVFHGALLVGILERRPIPDLLRLANAAAALKCRCLGGQKGIAKRTDVNRFLASHPANP
ncbi:MAG: PfkB family carbohydrate kinase [Pseudomonadota bacterium]